MPKTPWISVVLLLPAALSAGAQPADRSPDRPATRVALYHLDETPRPPVEGSLAVPGAAEEFLLSSVDPEAVAADPESVLLDLPFGPTVEAVRTRFVEYDADWKSWFGTLRIAGTGDRTTGYVYLGYHGDQLTALIDFRGEVYRIVGGLAGSHRLVRLSENSGTLPCGTEDVGTGFEKHPPQVEHALGRLVLPPPEVGTEVDTPSAKTHYFPTVLDVLALFPKVFFSTPAAQTNLINFVEDSIALANDAFTNSNVNAVYDLLYVGPLVGPQPPSTGVRDGRAWLNTNPSEVVSLRNAFGADVVALFIPFNWDDDAFCGIANLPQADGTIANVPSQQFGQRAFSVHRKGCGFNDFTLAHEIGHNYGMRHEDGTTGSTHLFPNGRGHQFLVNGQAKASIMACTCGESGEPSCVVGSQATCNRIPYFSNEWVSYSGVPTGTSTRNNAVVGGTQIGSYASFRATSSNTPPNASFTVSCSGSTCTFNASGSTDNTTIPSGGYYWHFGDGTTGSGKIVNHTYASGSFWVYLVVTDSGGQQDFTRNSASL